MDIKQYKKDLKYGFNAEVEILKVINKFFKAEKTKNKYAFFDFRDNTNKIDFELKTRRIYKGQYDTIFFAKHKLISGRKRIKEGDTNRVIYLFCFNKKYNPTRKVLYYWEDDGTDDGLEFIECGNYARGDKPKPLVAINIDKLKLFKYCPH